MSPNPEPFGRIGSLEDLLKGPVLLVGLIFLLWFLNMALVGWLAGRKGRESGYWAVLALFTGPIALVAILLAARRPRPADADLAELTPATRVRLTEDSQLELDVAGRLARLRGQLVDRVKGRPTFRLVRSTEWQWSDGTPMTVDERARLRREVGRIGKRAGWILTLDADDAR